MWSFEVGVAAAAAGDPSPGGGFATGRCGAGAFMDGWRGAGVCYVLYWWTFPWVWQSSSPSLRHPCHHGCGAASSAQV